MPRIRTIVAVQTKTKLKAVATKLLSMVDRRVLICPHVGVDGDALGSALALRHALMSLGIITDVIIDEEVPPSLLFIPDGEEAICIDDVDVDAVAYDFGLLLDCHELARIGKRGPLFARVPESGIVDHHVSDRELGELDVIDISMSSTAEMIYHLIQALSDLTNISLFDQDVADQLMAGMISDTGRFSFSNVTAGTFAVASALMAYRPHVVQISYELFDRTDLSALRMRGLVYARINSYDDGVILTSTVPMRLIEACGSTEYDLNTIPADMRKVDGVAVVFLIRETTVPGELRVNIRTDQRVHAAELAMRFSGGGHARAAGLTLMNMDLKEAEQLLVATARDALKIAHA